MELVPVKIRDVWSRNLDFELMRIHGKLGTYNMVALDTEFPGFLRNTPRDASEAERYYDLKFNVDRLKLIQLGLTLFDDEGKIGGSWQINFSNFDVDVDPHVPASIQLLRNNGIDLERSKRQGIDIAVFAKRFKEILSKRGEIKWVTFHGLYDLAYLLRLLTDQKEMPCSVTEFAEMVGDAFCHVYDVKFMAKYCHGLMDGALGLERLSKILMVERLGEAHQAGSDSLLTARVFLKMMKVYDPFEEEKFEGFLYGIEAKTEEKKDLVFVHFRRYYRPILRCPTYYYAAAAPPPPMLHGLSSYPLRSTPVFMCY